MSSTTGASVTANPTVTTIYTVTGTDGNGCENTAQVEVTVNSLPTASITGNAEVCLGDVGPTITFTGANGTAPYTFTYNIDGGPNQTATSTGDIATVAVPTTTAGTFIYNLVSVEDASSTACNQVQTGSVTVTVNSLPIVLASADDSEICEGSSTTLTASGATDYVWSPSAGLSSTTGASVTANPTVTTIYTVTGTDGNGCENTAQVEVTVNSLPIVSVSSDIEICEGSSTTLTASGATDYVWSPSAGLSSTTGASVTANPTVTTTYTVTGVDGDGCENTAQVTVIVNPLPTVSVFALNTEICTGSSTTLIATGASTYSWSPSAGLSSTTGSSVTANPTVTTTYTVTGTDINGCENTAQVEISVNPYPDASFTGLDNVYCSYEGSSVLTPVESGGVFTGNGIVNGNEFDPVVAGVGLHFITYTIQGANLCESVSNQIVEVVNPAVASFIGVNTQYCNNDAPVSLNAIPTGGVFSIDGVVVNDLNPSSLAPGNYTLSYEVNDVNNCYTSTSKSIEILDSPDASFSGINVNYCINDAPVNITLNEADGVLTGSGIINETFNPSFAGVGSFLITHTISYANGCNDSYSTLVNVWDLPLGDVTVSGDTLIAEYTGTGVTYQWVDCETSTVIPGATGQKFEPTSSGNYAVIIKNGGCETISACTKISVSGIDELTAEINNIVVYPNPNKGVFIIKSSEELNVEVFNSVGQIVYQGNQYPGTNEINLGFKVETGLYVVRMTNKQGYSYYENIVIQN